MVIADVLDGTRMGLGCLALAAEDRPSAEIAKATIRTAIDRGVLLIDTADCYGIDQADHGRSESLVAEVLRGFGPASREHLIVATKGGLRRGAGREWIPCGEPDYLRSACRASLKRLGVDHIDLYQLHRPDPNIRYEDSVGTLQELRREGLISEVGVSNVDDDLLDRALATGPVASVQNKFSLFAQGDRRMVERCAGMGLPYLAWSPLGGRFRANVLSEALPQGAELAKSVGLTVHELILAWLLGPGTSLIAIPGCISPQMIESCLRAAGTLLPAGMRAQLDALGPEAAAAVAP